MTALRDGVLERLGKGGATFSELQASLHLNVLDFRKLDALLQRLRRAGHIRFDTTAREWVRVQPPPENGR